MTIIQAVLMGLLQGVTEFLPVSSSGHLAIFKYIAKLNTETGMLFDVLLHVGTLLAICVVFYKDIFELFREGFGLVADCIVNTFLFLGNLFKKNDRAAYRKVADSPYRRFVLLIIIATIPTGIIGILDKSFVEYSERSLLVPGICLLITAVLLYTADHVSVGSINESSATYKSAFMVGCAQGIATLPGLSRSGTTITACLLQGYDKDFAVRMSFIMSIPAILGAAVLELKDIGDEAVSLSEMPLYIVGMIVAAVVGYVCIKTMLVIVRKQKFTIFSIYCMVVGLICVIGYFVI